MAFQLDRRKRLSYAAQVQRQALAHLVAGRLHPGDRLPSVRQLARDLGISRTTAERIQDVLCETTLAEIRPRSGAFVAWPDDVTEHRPSPQITIIYEFLKQTILRARELGVMPSRLAQLVSALDEETREGAIATFPIIATRDAFECMYACFESNFPAHILHLKPNAGPAQFPATARYVLTGYYLRGRGRKMADAVGRALIYVRYNVALLDRAMNIPADEMRYFVTRDADNAETTRGFLASAYPELSTARYAVMSVEEFLKIAEERPVSGTVWPTITAAPLIAGVVPARQIEILHPLLADDFIEELRCLALLG
jgi:GntR family transcriptional regulator